MPADPVSADHAACPPWCTRSEPHGDDLHIGRIGDSENVWVSVFINDGRDVPKVHVDHLGSPFNRGLLIESRHAIDLAELLARLGHEELAGLVRQAGEVAKRPPAEAIMPMPGAQ
jgi:hypothetical protein